MNREEVDSSMMRSVGYDCLSSILEIEFNSGPVWQYSNVPESVYYDLMGTDSKGRFFHREIKNQYPESRVG